MWVQPFRSADVEVYPPRHETGRVAVLLNANARKVTPKVIRALSHVVAEGDLFLSRSELDARRIAQQVVDRRYHTVFLGGGDGTLACFVNEIANQVNQRRQHHPTELPRFGVLKLGTGNSVAEVVNASGLRGDGIVDDVLRARAGEVPGYRTVDLLTVEGRRAPFCGLGVDAKLLNDYVAVKQTVADGPLARLMTGPGGYFASVALKTLPFYLTNPNAVECEVINGDAGLAYRMGPDGKPVGEPLEPGAVLYRGKVMMASAGTIPYYGFALKMFPFAGKRRGMMNLRLATIPAAEIVANLGGLWKGTWFPEGMRDFLTREAVVRFATPMPFQIAGDAHGARDELHVAVDREPIELVDFTGALH
jgi:diacylglycerol kinase family enzyme